MREIRLELTRLLQHYLLRVARLPISPLALTGMDCKITKDFRIRKLYEKVCFGNRGAMNNQLFFQRS